ncbi:MAG: hypothetical protein ABJH45_14680 [Paracoccaceae bacterium]
MAIKQAGKSLFITICGGCREVFVACCHAHHGGWTRAKGQSLGAAKNSLLLRLKRQLSYQARQQFPAGDCCLSTGGYKRWAQHSELSEMVRDPVYDSIGVISKSELLCNSMSSDRGQLSYRISIIGLTLFVSACYEAEKSAPTPIPAMVEVTKRAYSTKTFTAISAVEGTFRTRFEDDFGQLNKENYQVEPDTNLGGISDHYANQLEQEKEWKKFDAQSVNVDETVRWYGWHSEDDLFIVFSVLPESETEYFPVFTLSTLETQK